MPEIGPADIWFDPRKILPAAKNALMYPVTHPAQTAEFGLSMAPGSGEAMAGVDAWNASGRAGNALLSGNYGQAAGEYGNMLLGTLGAIPGAGVIARGTKRGAAWMDRNLPAGVNRLLDAAMPSDPQNTLNAIPAWHGSPHDFDEFKLDKIGTGEGAQSYGHGLYFAEHPDVAKQYRDNLSTYKSAQDYNNANPANRPGQVAQWSASDMDLETIDRALSVLEPNSTQAMRDEWIRQGQKLHDDFKSKGRLYHAELDVEPHDLLDWDKPLSQQSEQVRAAIQAIPHSPRPAYSFKGPEIPLNERAGGSYYHGLAETLGRPYDPVTDRIEKLDHAAAANALREAGIPGIKYLDQGSRGAEGGATSNYVIFDDKLVKVLSKDGKPLTNALAGADLPMDEASRMARAKEMGYADQPFYRGEASGHLPNEYEGATPFFSRDQEYARGFATQGGQADPREFRLNLSNTFSDHGPLTAAQYGRIVEAASADNPKLANDLAEQIAPGKGVGWLLGFAKAKPDFVVVEPGGAALVRHAIERGSSRPAELFRSAGFDALDSGRDVRSLNGEGIRLKDARFDPAKASSRNIMAGVAGAVAVPAYLLSGDATSRRD